MTQPQVAVVTGANRGIGAAVVAALRERGVQVVATSREPKDGFVTLDVTRHEHVAALADRMSKEGGLDILVNNAGVSLDGFDEDVALTTLTVNFFGAMHVTDALLPAMRPGARIVMVSSGMGELSHLRRPVRAHFEDPRLDRATLVRLMKSFVAEVAAGTHANSGWPSNAYSVSKVGMNGLVRVLAYELAADPRKIAVNAACPGWVRTRMGGRSAPRSIEEGARTIVWLAMQGPGGPSGGFFRDERKIPW